eukprot:CAMPEP_0174720426 /NCGR_PEP_ID=MMETSP1094-20130205/33522_1 /TAXON_ID=156173 /ORGANISM="Chrysochromulina brevifilum, Strain UTEX LB 985" /LENGTH=94 /DNA_ID=CAMNT_0015920905 /DNA_START=95 /DNA_END=380 /DNA_ORIENTATION=-
MSVYAMTGDVGALCPLWVLGVLGGAAMAALVKIVAVITATVSADASTPRDRAETAKARASWEVCVAPPADQPTLCIIGDAPPEPSQGASEPKRM